jgi:hypothetical protein
MPAPISFTVKLFRRDITDAELLADIKSVAADLQTDRLSGRQYDERGQFSAITARKRFGSWTAAVQQAGLRPAHRFNITRKQLLADLRRVANQLQTKTLTVNQYRQFGQHDFGQLKRQLGPWYKALNTAGLRPGHYRGLSAEELFENLKSVWQKLGAQPTITQMRKPLSRYSAEPYLTKFRTWCRALRAFDQYMHPQNAPKPTPPARIGPPLASTHINHRLRYLILKRDHFKCRACGRSPATDPAVQLQIDHKHPRSKGGKSTRENLQTLCEICNGGKSDML